MRARVVYLVVEANRRRLALRRCSHRGSFMIRRVSRRFMPWVPLWATPSGLRLRPVGASYRWTSFAGPRPARSGVRHSPHVPRGSPRRRRGPLAVRPLGLARQGRLSRAALSNQPRPGLPSNPRLSTVWFRSVERQGGHRLGLEGPAALAKTQAQALRARRCGLCVVKRIAPSPSLRGSPLVVFGEEPTTARVLVCIVWVAAVRRTRPRSLCVGSPQAPVHRGLRPTPLPRL